jgi:hypothetical protein
MGQPTKFRYSIIFDNKNITSDLDIELRLFLHDLKGKHGGIEIEFLHDILLEDFSEGIVLATIVVFYDRDVHRLADAIYDFAVRFSPSRLPKIANSDSKYFNEDYDNNEKVFS